MYSFFIASQLGNSGATLEDAALAEKRVSTLMGDDVVARRNWINSNVDFSVEDDFIVNMKK
ncbi:DNA topoisomerase 4 subunit B [Mycoplasmopsis gallopavonis]|uniref:DNA topoisomerase 4 subunit B n=1 Tax=Mycoplasmopsis gallopavonis TaxID=76629 RepID=A0A449AZI9_9BACT|nr:hypothetical protein [Mycoplasmopsis gallopavonis]VEU72930.1 DNA topoisomerase 4 subunit B [Mycoplasmopsis gallopavonis]